MVYKTAGDVKRIDTSFVKEETLIDQRPVKDVKMIDNLSEFVLEAGPEDYLVRCRVTRCNRGLDRGEGCTCTCTWVWGRLVWLRKLKF